MGCLQNKNTQIEQYVSIYLKISDMSAILGISATLLREDIADKSTEVSRRYHRGKAASRVKLLHHRRCSWLMWAVRWHLRIHATICWTWKMMNNLSPTEFAYFGRCKHLLRPK